MKSKKFFEMTDAELQTKLKELKEELFNLRFQHATNQLTNPMVIAQTRHAIARVKTAIRQQEIAKAKNGNQAVK